MKIQRHVAIGLTLFGTLTLVNCSSSPLSGAGTEGKEISATGPTVLNERVQPKTVELNRSLQPFQTPEIVADVKDFKGNISTVKLSFLYVPLEIPMKNIGGTTWSATLSPKELRTLAVSGQTAQYEANIIAKDDRGQIGVSKKPVTINVKAPDLAQAGRSG